MTDAEIPDFPKGENVAFLAHHYGLAHTDCWCATCEQQAKEELLAAGKITDIDMLCGFMHLCDKCGYKRCPRATFHEHACTGSNKPGQPGSRYA